MCMISESPHHPSYNNVNMDEHYTIIFYTRQVKVKHGDDDMSYNGVPTGQITLKKLGQMDYTALQSSSSGGSSPISSLVRTISQSARKLPLVSSASSREMSRPQSRERSHKLSDITTSANENSTIEEHSTSLVKKLRSKKTKGSKDSTEDEEDDVTNERLFEILDKSNASIGSLNEVITKCHIAIERLQSRESGSILIEEIKVDSVDESSDEGFLAYYCCCCCC